MNALPPTEQKTQIQLGGSADFAFHWSCTYLEQFINNCNARDEFWCDSSKTIHYCFVGYLELYF